MNSLADAAAQASAAAAEAAAAARLSAPASSSIEAFDRSASSQPSYPRSEGSHSTKEAGLPASPPSDAGSQGDMTKTSADTPLRRALLDSEKPEKRGSNLACLKCRAIKVKCSRANVDDERCKRCNRLDLDCEFKEHHRGRKPKKRPRSEADSTGGDEEDQLEDDEAASLSGKALTASPVRAKVRELSRSPPTAGPTSTNHQEQHQAYSKTEHNRFEANEPAPKLPSPKGSVHGRWFGPYLQPIPSFQDSLFPRKADSRSQHQSNDQAQHAQPYQHRSFHPDRSRELPPLTMPSLSSSSSHRNSLNTIDQGSRPSLWDSAQGSSHRVHPSTATLSMASDLRDDPVRQHVISMDQAHELFDYFFAELNPPLALLDASLHTIDHCRQNAPILFSTILSVASRFFLPQHHRQCHRIAKSILNLAAAEEICSMDHIQSLILVITWKDAGDRTIVRKAFRAIGYAYELGLHATFEYDGAAEVSGGSRANEKRSDTFSLRSRKRLERDRQRTWIVLCLVHELVRRDDRNTKPRPRTIPLDDYPDPYLWIKQAGDVLLPIDSRLCWSLDMSISTIENEPFLDLINRSEDATAFGGFFDRYRGRLDMLRKRYFDVRDGVFHPKFPMDESAVAELPYLDAFRDFYICQSTWHWAAKVASQRRAKRSELAEQQDNARSAFWFAQTVDAAMRGMRLFAYNVCKPGYVRVGHDYLVITASEMIKWFYLYRDHLDASTVTVGVEYLRATLRECSQPQRLPSGEIVDTEREAPGYLVRFLGAIFDAGLNRSFEKAQSRLTANVELSESKVDHHWSDAGRNRAHSVAAAEGRGEAEQGGSSGISGSATRRPPWGSAHTSYQLQTGTAEAADRSSRRDGAGPRKVPGGSPPFRDIASATARYSTAPSLPRGRSELGSSRMAASSPAGGVTSYERGGGVNPDKSQASPATFGAQQDVAMGAPYNANNSVAPHPAYLASPGGASGTGNMHQGLGSGFAVQNASSPWSSASTVTPSWSNNNLNSGSMLASSNGGGFVDLAAAATGTDFNAAIGGLPGAFASSAATSQPKMGVNNAATNVVPLAADIGKNSIEGLAACLNTRDLTYWQDILGFDLATPAV
ncbi:Zn(2)-C6 fungal-type DNA-binding domain protein [Kalmanozyma brasiliensis GHG001]|uniref:Zn(2)-C6 fungal-type DNA-binding domain protein n=1 Tax=Kalmanozyma brasiliensis (strain GHG001) TaxID=1365824 RepID=UPI0028680B9D|nr:Zn(2)-C6 fungal-type DNA-binding domain protein [Kalmanozyma brasiliensis GHG001]EST07551.2 Zn(2)-C6 fungal-type DNA-binding domain protein [Kalmanozyma brasiliensis GHG001]